MKKILVAFVVVVLLSQFALFSSVYAVGSPDVELKMFVHYAKPAKPSPPTKDSGSYTVFAKWSLNVLPVIYRINPSDSGMSNALVTSTIVLSAEEWDDGGYSHWGGVSSELFSYDDRSTTKTYADFRARDGENTIAWGDYQQDGVIAVTFVWYTRGTKLILEFDMLFDTDYAWGNADGGNTAVMDLQNIATHELGHAVGLGDLYRPNTALETMYGYADYGETTKRDLYYGDIAGITSLYG